MNRDWISSLPDEILGRILSLLPTKAAASTSVLSKRWRNLLGLVDNLSFDELLVPCSNEEEAKSGSHGFCDFVVKTLALLSNSPIKKVSLCHVPRPHRYGDYARVYHWIYTVMERGLLELHLHATPCCSFVDLKRELLTSNTLVKLTLSGQYWPEFKRVYFPALKSLSFLSVLGFGHPEFCLLLDGCPVLEDLFITDANHSYPPCCGEVVESESIKRLVVFVDLPDSQEDHSAMLFNAPSLVYLDYSSYVFENHEFVDMDLLVEARLNLRLWESTSDYDFSDDDDDNDDDDDDDYYYYNEPKEPIFGDVTNLVAGITNIVTLHLSPDSLETLHFCCESMPVFNNLLNLSIESNNEKGWQVMPILLKSCPNLHTLVIKGLLHRVTNRCGDACACISKKQEEEEECCLWTCQVKVLEISDYRGSFQELKQMRHFLAKLKCLETVKVGVEADNNNDNSGVEADNNKDNSELLRANLLTLLRISLKCNIQFI